MSLWEIFRGWFNSLLQSAFDWANPGEKEAREKNAARIKAQDVAHKDVEAANEATEARVVASEAEIDKSDAGIARRQAEREARRDVAEKERPETIADILGFSDKQKR